MSVSLKEVASRAGVSMSTVSRVLSGDERAQISAGTQETVRRAAEDLGYRPNRFARGLITGRTQTIGLMISRLTNPFFLTLIASAEEAAKSANYNVFIDADNSHSEEYLRSGHLRDWPVDGIIMWTWSNTTLADYIGVRAEKTPVVYICESSRSDGAGTIVYDLESGARKAIHHALQRGYRAPALVVPCAGDDWARYDTRAGVYREECAKAGIPLKTIVTEKRAETREAGFLTGLALASRPQAMRPDVLLCHNDIIAVGLYHGLLRAGVKIPQDIAIIGFDGIDEGLYLDKRLTTVRIPMEEIGRLAIERLLAHIGGKPGPHETVIPSQFVAGETS